MNLNLTSTIKMPDHELRRQVIELCKKVGKPLLKLSTKDYIDNGLGHLVEQFKGQAGLVNIEVFNETALVLSVLCLIRNGLSSSRPILMMMSFPWEALSVASCNRIMMSM